MPTKVGTQTSVEKTAEAVYSARPAHTSKLLFAWIPAFAGMTSIGGPDSAPRFDRDDEVWPVMPRRSAFSVLPRSV